jgi:hypothetical protein
VGGRKPALFQILKKLAPKFLPMQARTKVALDEFIVPGNSCGRGCWKKGGSKGSWGICADELCYVEDLKHVKRGWQDENMMNDDKHCNVSVVPYLCSYLFSRLFMSKGTAG